VLRKETIAAFHGAVVEGRARTREESSEDKDDNGDGDDDFLVPREKTKDELLREEEEYRAFLEREVGEDLAGLITVEGSVLDGDAVEEADPKGKKKRRKKEQGKIDSTKEQEDHEFLMKFVFFFFPSQLFSHDILSTAMFLIVVGSTGQRVECRRTTRSRIQKVEEKRNFLP
jgi:hypothetical protein